MDKGHSGSDPLHSFVQNIGGTVYVGKRPRHAMSDSISMAIKKRNAFDIYLSSFTGPLRDRFTVAHDLGHYFLHSNQGTKPMNFNLRGYGLVEIEAYWFALTLLLPMKELSITP